MISTQVGYQKDMEKYKQQVERYNMDVRLRGINNVEDTQMKRVSFTVGGEQHSIMVNVNDNVDKEVIKKAKEILNAKIK